MFTPDPKGLKKEIKKNESSKAKQNSKIKEPSPSFDDAIYDSASDDFALESSSIHRDTARTPRVTLNSLFLTILLAMGFALQGYMGIPLPDPVALWLRPELSNTLPVDETLIYTLQIPLCLFIGAFLGLVPAVLSIVAYLFLGLFFIPLFANGGGLQYVTEPGFGYFVGMLLGAIICAKLMESAYKKAKNPLLCWAKLLFASFVSVLAIHFVGLVGLSIMALLGAMSLPETIHWASHLTASSILYDFAVSLTLLWLVRPLRYFLWTVIY